MTKEEIKKLLDNTKVYVNGKSQEIQEKLFSFGYKWPTSGCKVCYTESPFLFMTDNNEISRSNNMELFKKREYTEISADEILSLQVTKSYRPFKNGEECWNEMQKHQPFGWVYRNSRYRQILAVGNADVRFADSYLKFEQAADAIFPDGTPFGIEE